MWLVQAGGGNACTNFHQTSASLDLSLHNRAITVVKVYFHVSTHLMHGDGCIVSLGCPSVCKVK